VRFRGQGRGLQFPAVLWEQVRVPEAIETPMNGPRPEDKFQVRGCYWSIAFLLWLRPKD
jgi:hypothetical protein